MAEQDLQQQHVVPVSGHANLRLTEFWRDAPHAWFRATEAQFRLRNIVDDDIKYSLLLTALPRDAFRVVAHLVVDDPPADTYVQLKAALIASHVLSNYQWVEALAKMEPLGGRRPSEMLTAMLELCPRGEEGSTFFFFLQRLPREIRVLLADENPADLHAVADKADKLVALHSLQSHEMVAATMNEPGSDEEDATAAAVKSSNRGGRKQFRRKKAAKQQERRDHSSDQGQKKSSLCFYHASFGDKANNCRAPCAWSEN
jgi:hypothetical protein